ncbi:MAG: hypothetical protein JW955_16325 [Sedimentisphaerales bacterium]|nr:hypothetical protein [Sedimentisphaerales bacterium]
MEAKLTFKYDREADILHIDKCPPHVEQESEELPDEIIARLNPDTREVENLEVSFFSTRLLRTDLFELLVGADLRLTGANGSRSEYRLCRRERRLDDQGIVRGIDCRT